MAAGTGLLSSESSLACELLHGPGGRRVRACCGSVPGLWSGPARSLATQEITFILSDQIRKVNPSDVG